MLRNYDDFCRELLSAGFSIASGHDDGVFSVIDHGWGEDTLDNPIRWHTGSRETDPWEWRMRVLEDRADIAYAKMFFHAGGFITKQWYPYFLAVRRPAGTDIGVDASREEVLSSSDLSPQAKRIYAVVSGIDEIPLHEIKEIAGFSSADKSKFDRALIELQMKLLITMCGQQQKLSKTGEPYGWFSTVFCTTENFWRDGGVFEKAARFGKNEAIDVITEQVYRLNPHADPRQITKFITG
jgi:hypothetical protein